MGIEDLQKYLESTGLEGGIVPVDLLKIARNVTQRQQPHNANRKIKPLGNKLKLVVDAENCLDRLYGGYFSDWACGGQWNRMVQFLSLLTRAIERGNIELAVVFNGTIESCRMNEWIAEQANVRQKVNNVLKHIITKGTPPPKIWWTAPTCVRAALRMALRHLGITVMCTMDDHHQEVIAYCRENGFHGLLADDAEYVAFDPPRYFSSANLKLTYKGSLETKEFMVSALTKSLQITQEQLCIMAGLSGNFLLPGSELKDLYVRIGLDLNPKNRFPTPDATIKALADFVRGLPSASNMDALIAAVFGSVSDKRASKFRQSVQYYLNGTASGFLKYCAPPVTPKDKKRNVQNSNLPNNIPKEVDSELEINGVGFASETVEQQEESLQNYKLATVNCIMTSDFGLDPNPLAASQNGTLPLSELVNGSVTNAKNDVAGPSSTGKVNLLVSSSSSNGSSVPSSPKRTIANSTSIKDSTNYVTPVVSADILRTASLRHQKGLMASEVLHVLSTQEIRLPCLMEDEIFMIYKIYQPLRQRIYAVLFNLHHLRYVHSKKKESGEVPANTPQPDVIVKEWIYSRQNPFQSPEMVKAEPLPWAVPTIQRLWFGPAVDDKRRRMRALLSCLNSDTPLILNTGYVPQHMLIMACVLRYIMSQKRPIFRKPELDAFLCHAFNVDLMNPQYLQELTLNIVKERGVQLATLFMKGVELALLANDACGAPLPWLMCCPWLYFDGKLFNHTLNRSAHCKNILEVCENHIERVVKVERMRKAILEGLDVQFVKTTSPTFQGLLRQNMVPQGMPSMPLPSNRIPSGMRPRPISSRGGGQLQVAGVVVGSWGANYGYQQNSRQQHQQQQQHHQQHQQQHSQQLGGYQGRGRGLAPPAGYAGFHQNQGMGRGRGQQHQQRKSGAATFPVPKRNTNVRGNKRKNNTNKVNKNQQQPTRPPLTVKTDIGDIPVNEVKHEEECVAGKPQASACAPCPDHKGQGDAPPIVDAVSS